MYGESVQVGNSNITGHTINISLVLYSGNKNDMGYMNGLKNPYVSMLSSYVSFVLSSQVSIYFFACKRYITIRIAIKQHIYCLSFFLDSTNAIGMPTLLYFIRLREINWISTSRVRYIRWSHSFYFGMFEMVFALCSLDPMIHSDYWSHLSHYHRTYNSCSRSLLEKLWFYFCLA